MSDQSRYVIFTMMNLFHSHQRESEECVLPVARGVVIQLLLQKAKTLQLRWRKRVIGGCAHAIAVLRHFDELKSGVAEQPMSHTERESSLSFASFD